MEKSETVSGTFILVKGCKPVQEGHLPAYRMLVSRDEGMEVPLNNVLADIDENVADRKKDRLEINSTEHQLHKADEFNRMILDLISSGEMSREEASQLLLIGADVKALFHSMSADVSARLVNKYTCESDLQFLNLRYKEMTKYIALCSNPADWRKCQVAKLIP